MRFLGYEISSVTALTFICILYAFWSFTKILVTAFDKDLGRIPGPFISRFTGLPLKFAVLGGRRSVYIHELHERYGPYVRIAPNQVSTADIEAWRKIHRIGSDYNKGQWYQGQSPMQYSDETCGVFGILNNKTASHRRRLFQSAGTKKAVAEWEPQVIELVDLTVEKIKADLRNQGKADVMKWWTFMASDVVSYLAFGESFDNVRKGERSQLIHDIEATMPLVGLRIEFRLLSDMLDLLPKSLVWRSGSPWDRFTMYGRKAVANTRLALKGGNQTLFSKMVDEVEGANQAIPDYIVEQEAANVMIAGTDTTAMTLTYLTYRVLQHPAIHKKLVEEISKCSTRPDWAELENLPYLNNVISEAMRLDPAIPGTLMRVVPIGGEDFDQYVIPAGTIIGTQAWTFHHDGSVFEDPLKFDPDRWDNPTPAMKEHLMGFGGPRRICLGQNIAYLEMLHAVFRFFRECPDVTLASSTTEASMEMVDFFAIKPKAEKCEVTLA